MLSHPAVTGVTPPSSQARHMADNIGAASAATGIFGPGPPRSIV
ncbi:MAG: hypothetical protein V3T28_01580 [Gemmatimonadales bacterium]